MFHRLAAQISIVAVFCGAVVFTTGQVQPVLDLFVLLTVVMVAYDLAKRKVNPSAPSRYAGRRTIATDSRQRFWQGMAVLKMLRWRGIFIFVLGLIIAVLMYLSITPQNVSNLFAPLTVAVVGLLLAVLPSLLIKLFAHAESDR